MYDHLVLGGTFDHFHAGHKKLVSMAFSLSKHVMLGLAVAGMNEHKELKETILSYEKRKRDIESFATSLDRRQDLEILPIRDAYGTTVQDHQLQAIVVTQHTVKGAKLINHARASKSLPKLIVHQCDFFYDEIGEILSSTRIRAGVVNRDGVVYIQVFKKTVVIPEKLKAQLRKPLETVYKSFPTELFKDHAQNIFVGDVVTHAAIQKHIPFASAWIDGRSARKSYAFDILKPYILHKTHLINAAGTIQKNVVAFMQNHLIGDGDVYRVGGEEDLLTLPVILLAPLGSRVTYGNPYGENGVTVVEVMEEKKGEVFHAARHGFEPR